MDWIEKRSRGPECVRIGQVEVSRLLFADDLALLASSQQDLQCALDRFAAESELAGMKVSTKKTEVMVISRLAVDCTLHVSGVQLQQVEKFKYLGSWFASDGRLDRELDSRINLSSVVLRELWSVMGSARLSTEAKLAIYKSLFRPILTYGHESWIMTERTRSRVQAAEMRFLRRIFGVTRMDQVRNTLIREAINVEPLLLWVEKSQLRWRGHVERMSSERLVKLIFVAEPEGRRPVGRPRTRWKDQSDALIRRAGFDPSDAAPMAADRTGWRELSRSLLPRPDSRT